jgi:hypothetical protein
LGDEVPVTSVGESTTTASEGLVSLERPAPFHDAKE